MNAKEAFIMPEQSTKPKGKLGEFFSRFQYNAPVILTFTLLSFLTLVLGKLTGGASTDTFFCVYRTRLLDPLMYIRMITHVLGHVDYNHFISNFTVILLVGPMLEEKYGSKQLLEMIALTALVTGLIQVLFFPGTALLGASGIAFMLILLSSFANYRKGHIPITLILVAIIYLSGEIVNGLFQKDHISQMAHIIGGICGCVFGWFISRKGADDAA